jgi:hypothetical protein
MSEVEFERLLDVVRTAVAPIPGEDCMRAHLPMTNLPMTNTPPRRTPRAANDNAATWPLIPFPDGWNAVC